MDIIDIETVDLRHHDEEKIEIDVTQIYDENAVLIDKRLLRIDKGLGSHVSLCVMI